jgi:hypothetical protein
MSKYRIKAYFMHDSEQAAARQAVDSAAIADAEWTDGYVMGVVDETEIENLSKQGLVISLVEQIGPAAAGGPAVAGMRSPRMFGFEYNVPLAVSTGVPEGRPLAVTTGVQAPESKILSRDPRRIAFYIVRFHGPITEDRRKELRRLRIDLLERVTRNKYTARLEPPQVKPLAELPFVDSVRLYDQADTLRVGCPV